MYIPLPVSNTVSAGRLLLICTITYINNQQNHIQHECINDRRPHTCRCCLGRWNVLRLCCIASSWVWLIVLVLLLTGYGMIFGIFKGFANAHTSIHIMHLLGLVMMGIFVYLFHKPYKSFKQSVADERWPDAATALSKIRQFILANLVLGFVVIAVAVSGRYW